MFEINFEGHRYVLRNLRWTGGKKEIRELFEIAVRDAMSATAAGIAPHPDALVIERLRALKVPFRIMKQTTPTFVEGRIYSSTPPSSE
ncbi:MAG: hypothetical protein JNM66_14840 [Bryobacterales bacterium]|nr:hypothetical protein [Bryobacterales bacterium]